MRPITLLPLLLIAVPLHATPPPQPLPALWEQTAMGLLKDAHRGFTEQLDHNREARFGEAVTLLNLQPKTEANLTRADNLFTAIAAEHSDDKLGIASRYLRARIAHIHRKSPDPAAALAIYRELAASGSTDPLAQRALVQIALIELLEPGVSVAELHARHAALAKRGQAISDPGTLRDFNLVLGDVALRLGLPDSIVIDHLLAADKAGVARDITRRSNWLRIAELARRNARTDLAIEYYERFLAASLRDARRLDVQQRLAALRASASASSSVSANTSAR